MVDSDSSDDSDDSDNSNDDIRAVDKKMSRTQRFEPALKFRTEENETSSASMLLISKF